MAVFVPQQNSNARNLQQKMNCFCCVALFSSRNIEYRLCVAFGHRSMCIISGI